MLVRRLARPMLSAIFISGGIGALRHAQGHEPMTENVKPFLKKIGVPTDDMETLIRANGAVMVRKPVSPSELSECLAGLAVPPGGARAEGGAPAVAGAPARRAPSGRHSGTSVLPVSPRRGR